MTQYKHEGKVRCVSILCWFTLSLSLSLSLSFEQKSKERERERERVLTVFVWKKYGLIEINDIKFIQNKMERRRVKI